MERLPPISASLGAIVDSLSGKLDALLDSELKDGIEKLGFRLLKLAEQHDLPLTAGIWMKQVRELSYDMVNWLDTGTDLIGKCPDFKARVKEANERYDRYKLESLPSGSGTHLVPNPMVVGRRKPDAVVGLHGEGGAVDKLCHLLTDGGEELKVVSVVGVAGIGKTTLAKQLWREKKLEGFDCRAFVRTAKKPDMRRILRSILAQVRPHQPPDSNEVHQLIHDISQHLKDKRSGPAELEIIREDDLHTLDQVLVSNKETGLENLTLERCPPLELKHLLMLTTLKTLIVNDSDGLVGQLGGQGDVEWQLPVWCPQLQELEISNCPEFSSPIPISWIESLYSVTIKHIKLLEKLKYSNSSDGAELKIIGEGDLHSLDQVLVFDKETGLQKLTLYCCPPLELKHLLMLTSLRILIVANSVGLVGPLGEGQSDVEWQLPVEYIRIYELNGNTGEELTELLPHLPKLSKLEIVECENIKKLVVGDDAQQTTQEASEMGGGEITAAAEEEDDGDGVLLFPPHLCDSLHELRFYNCEELEGGIQALRSLQRLTIQWSPKFLSASLQFSRHIFPSSLQFLMLTGVGGMGTLEPLSNLSSLVTLQLYHCGEDMKCDGLQSLLTTGGQLNELMIRGSPRFFADWDPNPRRALEDAEGGEEQQTRLVSCTLQELETDDIAGLVAAPVCGFLSSSLTKLELDGDGSEGMERFSKEQEDALQLLSSLQELEFWFFDDLQQLPAGLRNLTSLKILSVYRCPAISSLPNDALPDSLEKLRVFECSEELKQYCRGLEGKIPEIDIL